MHIGRREFIKDSALGAMGFALAGSLAARSRAIPPLVSPDWLSTNLGDPMLIVLDIRSMEQYGKGHIPGANNVPFSSWAISRNGLSLELPPEDALRDLVGKSGMNADSRVVVVNRTETDFSRADATRVAWTCILAGIENTAVLDGGHNRWVREIKTVSTEPTIPRQLLYTGKMNRMLLASKSDVVARMGKAILVDNRVPEDYFGISAKPGHIKGSVNLPSPWAFSNDGTFRREEDLQAMAAGVIGTDRSKEVILYCGVGGYSSTWWFILTQIFSYRNARIYDGSMEEWIKDPSAPVTTYSWR